MRFDPSFSDRIVGPEDSEDVWIVTGEVSGRPTLREACRRRSRACYTQAMGLLQRFASIFVLPSVVRANKKSTNLFYVAPDPQKLDLSILLRRKVSF